MGVDRGVAGERHFGQEMQNVPSRCLIPQSEPRNDWGLGVMGEFGEAYTSAGGFAEKVDEDAFGRCSILIDQDTDGFVVLESFED